MYTNVGGFDRATRIIMGCGLISLVLLLRGDARWLGLLGIVPLATGLVRYCPLYSLFGWTTCTAKTKHA